MYARNYASYIADDEVTIRCTDKRKIVYHTDASLNECYDAIVAAAPADRGMLEKSFGLKYNAQGLMHNCRAIYKPVSHTIRDWMHMLVSGGMANVQLARVLVLLLNAGISLQSIGDFVESVELPRRHGKTTRAWVSRKRLGKKRDSLASFAGVMLSLIPILTCFMSQAIPDGHDLQAHRDCLILLNLLVGVLSLGPEKAMEHIDYLETVIAEWGNAFEELYTGDLDVKPKFHHIVAHLVKDAKRIGKLLSCFVLERKHRSTKRAALFTFRGIDNAVIKTLLNKQVVAMSQSSNDLFREQYLVKPKQVCFNRITLRTSQSVVMPSGRLHIKDVVYLDDGRAGAVIKFWANADESAIAVIINVFEPLGDNLFDTSGDIEITVSAACVIDAAMWFKVGGHRIHVIRPVRSML